VYEGESLRKFLAGEPDDVPWMQDWLSMVRAATEQGRRFGRVRVVSIPLSEYNRFSYALARHNNTAGEDIRYMSRDTAQKISLPNHDYWLFDSRTVALMYFDDDDRFTGAQIIDNSAAIVEHNYWRDAAWHHAVRQDDFATE
jgi:hypothetical protein